MMIGMFAVSEILRHMTSVLPPGKPASRAQSATCFAACGGLTKRYRWQIVRGSAVGTADRHPARRRRRHRLVDHLRDEQRFSKEPEKFGTGHVEGIIEAGAANNSALAGAWVPALVFGIPGDSITAIAIGVLYLKNLNPGPTMFTTNPQSVYAIFLIFVLANLHHAAARLGRDQDRQAVLRVPRDLLMPVILLFCVVGAFAINNTVFGVR